MSLNLSNAIIQFLKQQPEQKFSCRQIAEWVLVSYPAECQQKKAQSKNGYLKTDADLVTQLAAEISARYPKLQQSYPELKTLEQRPRKYYYSQLSDSEEVQAAEQVQAETHAPYPASTEVKLNEHDLYPRLSQYLVEIHRVYCKRIDEKSSSHKLGPNGNRWLHPDLVGFEDLSAQWSPEVKNCVNQYSGKRSRLWSFEVKLLLNSSNVRESFFQALSNSSWANFGYLVSKDIAGDQTLPELRMLSAAHGIGLIQLDADNPDDSQILIPARERSDIDWDSANRLAQVNSDFRHYLKLVRQCYQTGEVKPKEWDAEPLD